MLSSPCKQFWQYLTPGTYTIWWTSGTGKWSSAVDRYRKNPVHLETFYTEKPRLIITTVILSSKRGTYSTDLRWCRHQRQCCQTTCEQQSCGSVSASRSCLSRLSRWSPEFPPPQGSSPGSSCLPYVWLSESGRPTANINMSTTLLHKVSNQVEVVMPSLLGTGLGMHYKRL